MTIRRKFLLIDRARGKKVIMWRFLVRRGETNHFITDLLSTVMTLYLLKSKLFSLLEVLSASWKLEWELSGRGTLGVYLETNYIFNHFRSFLTINFYSYCIGSSYQVHTHSWLQCTGYHLLTNQIQHTSHFFMRSTKCGLQFSILPFPSPCHETT